MDAPADSSHQPPVSSRARAGFYDYCALARPSHWIKHIFIVPGIVLAALLLPADVRDRWLAIVLGFASVSLITSANYVMNEWLDARSDAFHPIKSQRPAVAKRLSPGLVMLEYVLLVVVGLVLAYQVSGLFFWTSVALLFAACVYNIPPLRTKDIAYLDVLTESLNNPLRLTLGWAMIDAGTLPPGSVLLSYWMGGSFLMGIKRLAEYRAVVATVGADVLASYRKSFARYTSISLIVSSFIYALLSVFFLAVFFIKYRIEYLLALPVLALLFGSYLNVGLQENSTVQAPERLVREPRMLGIAAFLVLLLLLLSWVDIPLLHQLTEPHYITLPWG